MSATIGSPSRCASERRFNTTTPQPSPRTMPSAPASNVRQRPVGESIRALLVNTWPFGERMALTPAAIATSDSRERRLWTARCTATRLDEQAVSIAIAGPWNPKTYARRPAAKFSELPVR